MKIDPKKYQVFVCYSNANFPVNYFIHTWFVCNEKSKVDRFDLCHFKNKNNTYIHVNYYPLFSGIEVFHRIQKWYWKGKLLYRIEGEDAKRMIAFIKKSKVNYPFIKKYSLLAPNSNTYVQWVLNNFPKLKLILPKRAIGKNYAFKIK